MDYRRTHKGGELREKQVGEEVTLSGWVYKRRDHGQLIFVDLRDRFGITQLIFDPDCSSEAYQIGFQARSEWVIAVRGIVTLRERGMENPKLATGKIEVRVQECMLLSRAKTPPFSLSRDHCDAHEEIRLRYRYLDMRRGPLIENFIMRHQVMKVARAFFDVHGFIELTTPLLGKSTPEGARDYLVPSRIYPAHFYALPQSPQLFKQLCMVGGVDRYFQIAPCFRDEDLRANRQPEFMQIDLEMSFAYPEDIKQLINQFLTTLFKECIGYDLSSPIREIGYQECVERYGTDRPDLRFDLLLHRLDEWIDRSQATLFREARSEGGVIKGVCVKGGSRFSRRELESYRDSLLPFGVCRFGWIKREEEGFVSGVTKYFTQEELEWLAEKMEMRAGDLLFLGGAAEPLVNHGFDHLRRQLAKDLGLIDPRDYACVWVTDFPLFELSQEKEKLQSVHHPFTHPHPQDLVRLSTNPLSVRSLSYDLVINGCEVGGGSQRIHDQMLQKEIFSLLKLTDEEISDQFGFFLHALQYGTPPHLGIAFGLDRLIMLLLGTEQIRDVIPFPKTQKASDLMMQAPAPVSAEQLAGLKIVAQEAENLWI